MMSTLPNPETVPENTTFPFPIDRIGDPEGASISTPWFSTSTWKTGSRYVPKGPTTLPRTGATSPPGTPENLEGPSFLSARGRCRSASRAWRSLREASAPILPRRPRSGPRVREVPQPPPARLHGNQSHAFPRLPERQGRCPLHPPLRARTLLLDGVHFGFGLLHLPGKRRKLPVDPRDEALLAGEPFLDVVHLVTRRPLPLEGLGELVRRLLGRFAHLGKPRLLVPQPVLRATGGRASRRKQEGGDHRHAERGTHQRAENRHLPFGKAERHPARERTPCNVGANRRNRTAGR